VLQWPGRETRSELFLWAALRELGVQPDQQLGSEVLGVVFEMPMKKGCDTLAAYADGSARYLNFSGAGIFWDAPDPTIGALGRNMIDATIPPSPGIRPRATLALPREKPQVTLLTRSGNYVLVGPPQKVLDASTALMLGLTSRNKAARQA
jgi:hypothetical protein